MEEAVALDRDRACGHPTVRGVGQRQPGAIRLEDPVEVGGAEEVALVGVGAAHRLLVGGEESGAILGAGIGTGDDPHLVSGAPVAVDLVAVASPGLRRLRGVGDLDDVALARPTSGGSPRVWRRNAATRPVGAKSIEAGSIGRPPASRRPG